MQKLLLCVFLLLSLLVKAQSTLDIINPNLTNIEKPYLYLGVDNLVVIKNAPALMNYDMEMTKGIITAGEEKNTFLINAKKDGIDTLKVTFGGRVIYKKAFIIDRLPDIMVTVGNITKPIAGIDEIMMQPMLRVALPGSYLTFPFTIKSFVFYTSYANSKSAQIENTGPYFNKEIVDFIKGLRKGTTLYFTDVKLGSPDGLERTVSSFTLKVQ